MKLKVFDLEKKEERGEKEIEEGESLRSKEEMNLINSLIEKGEDVEVPYFMDEFYSAISRKKVIYHLAVDSEDERRVEKLKPLVNKGYRVIILRPSNPFSLYWETYLEK